MMSGQIKDIVKSKDISVRLLKPTVPDVNLHEVREFLEHWRPEYDWEGHILVHDSGIAQFSLCDPYSHHLFYAALLLGKPSIKCKLTTVAPFDKLDEECDNKLEVKGGDSQDDWYLVE